MVHRKYLRQALVVVEARPQDLIADEDEPEQSEEAWTAVIMALRHAPELKELTPGRAMSGLMPPRAYSAGGRPHAKPGPAVCGASKPPQICC